MQLFDHYHIDDDIAEAVWKRHGNEIAKLEQKAKEQTDPKEQVRLEMEAARMSIWSKLDVIMADMQVLLSFWTKKRLVFVDGGEGEFEEDGVSAFKERFQRVVHFMEEIDEESKFEAAKRLVQCGTDEEARDAMEQLKLDCEL
jgi:hypothetical protein